MPDIENQGVLKGRALNAFIFLAFLGVLLTFASAYIFFNSGLGWQFWRNPPPFGNDNPLAASPYVFALASGFLIGCAFYYFWPNLSERSFHKDLVGVIGVVLAACGIGLAVVLSTQAAKELEKIADNSKNAADLANHASDVARQSLDAVELAKNCIEQRAAVEDLVSDCLEFDDFDAAHSRLASGFSAPVLLSPVSDQLSIIGSICTNHMQYDLSKLEEARRNLDTKFPFSDSFQESLSKLIQEKKDVGAGVCGTSIVIPTISSPTTSGQAGGAQANTDVWAYYVAPMVGLLGVGLDLSTLVLILVFSIARRENSSEVSREVQSFVLQQLDYFKKDLESDRVLEEDYRAFAEDGAVTGEGEIDESPDKTV